MTYWDIKSGGDDLKKGKPVEIFNRGVHPGSQPDDSSVGDKVLVTFHAHGEGNRGSISNATSQALTLTLEKAGEIKLELKTATPLIGSKSKQNKTEWIVV